MAIETNKIAKAIPDEMILVVKRTDLFKTGAWHGLNNTNTRQYLNLIAEKRQFLHRAQMETNPEYKQIIPYLIFEYNNHYFLMQRKSTASETRLQNKYSLGIGGHIREEDIKTNSLFDWATREFHEEVSYDGALTIEPLGFLNDDSNAVGQVHLGCVFLLHGSSDNISIKEEHKSGMLTSLTECAHYKKNMESWSSIVYDHLVTHTDSSK